MGVGVKITSENLNPKGGLFPKWRQKTMVESLSLGKTSRAARFKSARARRRGGSSRRRRGRRASDAARVAV